MRRSWRILIVLTLTAVFVLLVAASALAKGQSEACLKTVGYTHLPAFCDSDGPIIKLPPVKGGD